MIGLKLNRSLSKVRMDERAWMVPAIPPLKMRRSLSHRGLPRCQAAGGCRPKETLLRVPKERSNSQTENPGMTGDGSDPMGRSLCRLPKPQAHPIRSDKRFGCPKSGEKGGAIPSAVAPHLALRLKA
jgi:hypothetical protein